jgi:two-component system, NarL family, sensor kinase
MSAALKPPQQTPRRARSAVWLAWGMWLLVLAVNVVTFVLFSLPEGTGSTATKLLHKADPGLPMMVFATVGALIVSRRPSNVIGWLCWAIGLAVSLSAFGSIEAARTIAAHANPSAAGLVLYQLGQVLYLLPLLGLLPLLVLLFPTGRLPARRWRPVIWAFGAGVFLYTCSVLFKPSLGHGLPPTRWDWRGPRGCWAGRGARRPAVRGVRGAGVGLAGAAPSPGSGG